MQTIGADQPEGGTRARKKQATGTVSTASLFSFFSKSQAQCSQEEKISASQPPENATARQQQSKLPPRDPTSAVPAIGKISGGRQDNKSKWDRRSHPLNLNVSHCSQQVH